MSKDTMRCPRRLALVVLCSLVAAPLAAQAPAAAPRSHLRDPWQLSASGTMLIYATGMRVDAGNGTPGTDLDPESDLGLPTNVVQGRFGLRVRIAKRHELELGYLLARRGGERVLRDTIVVGDTSYAAGLRTQSDMSSDQLSVVYRFAFHMRQRHEMGATLGLGALMFHGDVRAVSGTTSGGPDTTITPFVTSQDMTVPTAALGLYGRWDLGHQWYVEADVRALYFKLGRVAVGIVDAGANTRRWVNSWLAIEAGYAYSSLNAELDPRTGGGGFSGRLKYGLHNLRLGIVATRTPPAR